MYKLYPAILFAKEQGVSLNDAAQNVSEMFVVGDGILGLQIAMMILI